MTDVKKNGTNNYKYSNSNGLTVKQRRLTPAVRVGCNGVFIERLASLKEEEESTHGHTNGATKLHKELIKKDETKTTDGSTKRLTHSSLQRCHSIPIMVSKYLLPLRPWSFSASLTPVALGAVIAYKATGSFNPITFLVSCLTVLAVHGAGNLANTYYDYIKGVDKDSTTKESQSPIIPATSLSPEKETRLTIDELVHLGVTVYSIGCLGFVCLVLLSSARMEHLALVYFGGLSCSFLYTGGIGLKYIGLGDVIILIIFGPISLLFSFMAQTGSVDFGAVLYAVPLALNTEAIFHSNNTRDIESDKKAGALTLAILIGPTFSHVLYALLLFVPYIIFIAIGLHVSYYFLIPLITIKKAFDLEKEFRSGNLCMVPRHTADLNLKFGLLYVLACCLSDSKLLPFLSLR
jgi:1,4-dihydroxy-2-naphthoate octaprenyltransferase